MGRRRLFLAALVLVVQLAPLAMTLVELQMGFVELNWRFYAWGPTAFFAICALAAVAAAVAAEPALLASLLRRAGRADLVERISSSPWSGVARIVADSTVAAALVCGSLDLAHHVFTHALGYSPLLPLLLAILNDEVIALGIAFIGAALYLLARVGDVERAIERLLRELEDRRLGESIASSPARPRAPRRDALPPLRGRTSAGGQARSAGDAPVLS